MLGELFGRGLVLLKLGRAAEAADAFRQVYELNPSCTDAASNQVVSLAIAGRHKEARTVLNRALGDHPEDPSLHETALQLEVNLGRTP
jgi:Flp pilus assembly protein TadD